MAFVKNNGYRTPHYFNCSPDSLEFSNNKDKKLRNYKHSAVDLVHFPGITVTALIYIRGYRGLFCASSVPIFEFLPFKRFPAVFIKRS